MDGTEIHWDQVFFFFQKCNFMGYFCGNNFVFKFASVFAKYKLKKCCIFVHDYMLGRTKGNIG